MTDFLNDTIPPEYADEPPSVGVSGAFIVVGGKSNPQLDSAGARELARRLVEAADKADEIER